LQSPFFSGAGALSPSGVSFFFFKQTIVALVVGGGEFHDN
jgi:hypothetical protein